MCMNLISLNLNEHVTSNAAFLLFWKQVNISTKQVYLS